MDRGVSKQRVRGNSANILPLRYNASPPNMRLVVTAGHVESSASSSADQCFISSDMRANLGRLFMDRVIPQSGIW